MIVAAAQYSLTDMILMGVAGLGIGAALVQTFATVRLERRARWMEETLDALTEERERAQALREELEGSR